MDAAARLTLVLRWGPVLAYAILISALSGSGGLDVPAGISDKAAHAAEFGLLAALLRRALAGGFLAPLGRGRAAAVLLACALYGAADEVHQSFTEGRDASAADAAADAAGALAVLLALGGLAGRRRPAPAERPALTLLSRPGCGLCDEAEEVLRRVQSEIPFTYKKVDVESDEALRRRYGLQVPVVLMEGRKVFKHRIDQDRLRRRLRRRTGEAVP